MTVGILGGGQLARMLALAGIPLGLRFRVMDPADQAPAEPLADVVRAPFDDGPALDRFARGLDVVTFEFENVPSASARRIAQRAAIFPPPEALEIAQDRLLEKQMFDRLGMATPAYFAIHEASDLPAAIERIGVPAVLKSRKLGYDGKGQCIVREPGEVRSAWHAIGGVPAILEEFVPFDRELSLLAIRSPSGELRFYPLVENHHHAGILRRSFAPSPHVSTQLQAMAEGFTKNLLESLGYVGVLAIELFERNGRLLGNEIAPRVHNSGHWTIEGARTSQFENHLRAILDWPLGSTAPVGHSAMFNFIGKVPDLRPLLETADAHVHLYGKEPRPGRKVGHVTLRADDAAALRAGIERIAPWIDAASQ